MQTIDFNTPWQIVVPEAPNAITQLAAQELSQTMEKITGAAFPVVEVAAVTADSVFILGHSKGESDGFRWAYADGKVEIHGQNQRGLLYGVYAFLEALGCRWVAPGADGERLPQGNMFAVPSEAVTETPALPGRCLILGHYAFLQEANAWIVWAARNRLNTLFLHTIQEPLAFGAAPESQYQEKKAAIVELARQREIVIEHGGHGLADLLPRELFGQMPEAFRMKDGERTPDHNFCPSNAAGLEIVKQNTAAHFQARPEVDVFHIWADDIPGGGWCECAQCQQYSPSEQALLATNAVAEVLAEVNPDAQLSFLAYHDTEAVPSKVTPRPNVCMLWAPRMRCYAHSTDDSDCTVNVPRYNEIFQAQVTHFEQAGSAPARVFEYYLDAILFKAVLPPFPKLIQEDLLFYKAAGAHTVQALMTGYNPWVNPQINAWLFARLAWNTELDTDALVADFCQATFGTNTEDMPAYYHVLEAAFALALELHPEQIKLDFDLTDIWNNPPTDMGDPFYAPKEELIERAGRNAQILELLESAHQHLQAAQENTNPEAWNAEAAAFQLYAAWLRFDFNRLQLYAALTDGKPTSEAKTYLEQAEKALADALAWDDSHIADPRFRTNFRMPIRAMWGLRLAYLRAKYFTPKALGWLVKLRALAQTVPLFLRLRNIYE
jgi:hypothetical protein